jgi:hypothetical protein
VVLILLSPPQFVPKRHHTRRFGHFYAKNRPLRKEATDFLKLFEKKIIREEPNIFMYSFFCNEEYAL